MRTYNLEELNYLMKTKEGKMKLAKDSVELNKLMYDTNPEVRKAVAEQGFQLKYFLNDSHWLVREELARQGVFLDVLMHDEDPDVRKEVAKQGYGHSLLFKDRNEKVRLEVAKHGYKIEEFFEDDSFPVREIACELMSLENAIVVERNFGTYMGNLYLYIFKDSYVINSGCYKTDSLEEWIIKCEKKLGQKRANEIFFKIEGLLKTVEFNS